MMFVPYWWCTKHAQLIMGTWPIYKKHFLQLILTKKNNFHLIKYLLATFIFFPFLFNLYLFISITGTAPAKWINCVELCDSSWVRGVWFIVIGTGHLHYSVSHFIHLAGAVPVISIMIPHLNNVILLMVHFQMVESDADEELLFNIP